MPVEFVLSVPEARLLLEAGLAILTCDPDRDEVVLRGLGGPSATFAEAEAPAAERAEDTTRQGLSSRLTIRVPPPVKREEPLS